MCEAVEVVAAAPVAPVPAEAVTEVQLQEVAVESKFKAFVAKVKAFFAGLVAKVKAFFKKL